MRAAKFAIYATGVALLVIMLFVVFFYDRPRVDLAWRTTQVQVGDPLRVKVTFEVDKPSRTTAECQVAAFDAEGNSAGRLTGIKVGPRTDGGRTTRLTVLVPTPLEPAQDAAVATCQITRGR
ncbi:MAG TPA: DUF4307 domain-containing protein [Mycobacteriales bacterium]|nr:DUF4307 domain-containing protein [Mycobacteriales bacterium]